MRLFLKFDVFFACIVRFLASFSGNLSLSLSYHRMPRLLIPLLFLLLSLLPVQSQWGRELSNMGMGSMGMGDMGFGMGRTYDGPSFRRSPSTQQSKSKGMNLGGMGAMYGPGMGMMGKKR
ncbi:hypothetical protein PMAYCL1PPCAC_29689 [Pristionchus mayeri]|uniref:Uncharacterized protein n=1 Tax=Pristionchus mayeri TaxID=1317129 RepID=A0AAN5DAI7_9BILA|nr:hypothetical protein PMAYCL1PPCAC_29689 [Pristionchus mayeri]